MDILVSIALFIIFLWCVAIVFEVLLIGFMIGVGIGNAIIYWLRETFTPRDRNQH